MSSNDFTKVDLRIAKIVNAEHVEGAEKLLWYMTANKVAPQFQYPPGYMPAAAMASVMKGAALDQNTVRCAGSFGRRRRPQAGLARIQSRHQAGSSARTSGRR